MSSEVAALGVPRVKIRTIPNGIALPDEELPPNAKSGEKRLVFIGRMLVEVKGLDTLAEAWRLSLERGRLDGWTLDLYGSGPDRDRVERLFGGLDGVNLHGSTDLVREVLGNATAFVLPSRVEGFSNTLLEALAAGCPVVGSAVSGTEDVLDPTSGWLFEPGDTAGLSACLDLLGAAGPERLSSMSSAASRVVRQYGIDEIASRWDELYEEMRVNHGR
jgi:glycosyltransferase involved in cell wall biosynthesis